ncbi:POU domain class 2-associating factor 2 [Eucyclogobius newberryi]|uniref:POU domain class 2-associating factor 2 n=1 Tax=Eucyclogobius newberryi TaxID=166745 RepID=UPI003B5D0511
MDTDFSKRVYQGVRVKHTVKDLLAEKRSRQTSGPRYTGGSTSPPSFMQMSGSHVLPAYYGMRRTFDSDFCSSTKQFSPDLYSSSLGAKSLGCEAPTMSSYSSLIDSYYPETFGDYRTSSAFSSSGSSFLPSSALSSLLPPFSSDTSHLFLRDSWEQPVSEPGSQVDPLCGDSLAPVSVSASMPSPEAPGSPSQYRSPSRGSSLTSIGQPYTLHPLEDAHYHSLTATTSSSSSPYTSSYACPPYLSTPELMSKMVSEEGDNHSLPLTNDSHSSWAKEDAISSWSPYEIRRAY